MVPLPPCRDMKFMHLGGESFRKSYFCGYLKSMTSKEGRKRKVEGKTRKGVFARGKTVWTDTKRETTFLSFFFFQEDTD